MCDLHIYAEVSMRTDMSLSAFDPHPPFRSALWSLTAVLLAAAVNFSHLPLTTLCWLLIGAPLVEETLFRAGLQTTLMRRAVPASAAWAALAFAAAHLLHQGPLQAALTALPAFGIGLVFARTRRLGDCIALHALCNACWVMGLADGSG
jgi:membrane protease YdiL (CAAX protease family)